jgi:osmotically-inducible protein OsmY
MSRARTFVALLVGALAALVAIRLMGPLGARPTPTDAELFETLRRRLRAGLDLPTNEIELAVADGVVELSGEVDTPELADELVRRAQGVPGVVRVENLLSLPEAPVR